MQALAAVAGRASASEALADGPRQAGQRMLPCGFPALDDFLEGGLARGQLTFLDASSALLWDIALGALCQATRGGLAVAVDGGNSLDPYLVAAHARRAGMAPRDVLGRLRVARAFTAHQMSTVLEETLPGELLDHRPELLLVSCLPELYLDEDVPWAEANALVGRAVGLLRDAAREHRCAVLATNLGLAKLAARPRLRALAYGADRVVRVLPARGAAVLEDLPSGRRARFQPAAPHQATLDGFRGAAPPGLAPSQLMVKGVA